VNNACGSRPSVVVMSACFSGIFVPELAAPNRMVLTAARPDRTSFGCGESDHYTFFDTCFLQSLPASADFPGLAQQTIACVAARERAEKIEYPSEPQLAVGEQVAASLRWR
jgi:Peptidase C13 family